MPGKTIVKYKDITIGKTYDAIESPDHPNFYIIVDDIDEKSLYKKSNFKPISEIRQEKLIQIGI
jgi:hypothetical protein